MRERAHEECDDGENERKMFDMFGLRDTQRERERERESVSKEHTHKHHKAMTEHMGRKKNVSTRRKLKGKC